MTTPTHLSPSEIEAFGRELDAIRDRHLADLGERDREHIDRIISLAMTSEAAGRLLLHFGIDPISFVLGTGALTLSKILENMEIGHNVMHGQYDWTRDPKLDSHSYEWDAVSPSAGWRHSHNFEHHTFTNVLGKDRDIGYELLRVSADQPWNPGYLAQPLRALWLALAFQWGVALHDLKLEELRTGESTREEVLERAKPFLCKAAWQVAKDYALYPALSGLNAPRVLLGNLLANIGRNVWAFAVIFCGHFPEGAEIFHEAELEGERRAEWYLRQLLGSANIEGGHWLHVLTGHLSHQIEHHLFPAVPAWRYPEMAREVRALCERYDLPYNTGSLGTQLKSVAGKIFRHALPTKPRAALTRQAPPALAA
ncbi:MAG: acyl-CoA desaturase [Deltaproteobacteria bacterium]|nr:acyl-CoA desaturase [Deltaproteobacteria bacterium]